MFVANRFLQRGGALIALLFIASCATPIAPTGGLPDKSPPQIVSTYPSPGQTNFRDTDIRFEFDKYMNRGSAARALRIEPDLGITYSLKWRRKSLILSFDSAFPDSVTVIISIGPEIADINSNRLGSPFQLAFSTGASIDSANVALRVLSFQTGGGEPGRTVGLFRGETTDGPASYLAETDTSGIARFRYLSTGAYTAVLMDDRNRNRIIDQQEWAVAHRTTLTPSFDTDSIHATMIYARADTISPVFLGVGLLSEHRIRARFSKSIRLSNNSSIHIVDSLQNRIDAKWLYSDPDDATVAYAYSASPLNTNQTYYLESSNVEDVTGNTVNKISQSFIGSDVSDTTRQRLIRVPESPIVFPNDTLMVVYSDIIRDEVLVDSMIVIDGETQIRDWADYIVRDNRLYIFRSNGWRSGQRYQIRFWNPQEQRFRSVDFRPVSNDETGSLEITPPEAWVGQAIVYELLTTDGQLLESKLSVNTITFTNLIADTYTVRAWLDTNGNGKWDQVTVGDSNTISVEPLFLLSDIQIATRMSATLQITETY